MMFFVSYAYSFVKVVVIGVSRASQQPVPDEPKRLERFVWDSSSGTARLGRLVLEGSSGTARLGQLRLGRLVLEGSSGDSSSGTARPGTARLGRLVWDSC